MNKYLYIIYFLTFTYISLLLYFTVFFFQMFIFHEQPHRPSDLTPKVPWVAPPSIRTYSQSSMSGPPLSIRPKLHPEFQNLSEIYRKIIEKKKKLITANPCQVFQRAAAPQTCSTSRPGTLPTGRRLSSITHTSNVQVLFALEICFSSNVLCKDTVHLRSSSIPSRAFPFLKIDRWWEWLRGKMESCILQIVENF